MPTNQPIKLLHDIVLAEYVEEVVGVSGYCTVSVHRAKQIATVDHDEQYCHVEFPTPENELEYPRLWRINEWRTSHTRYVRRKALSEHERNIAVRASELRAKFIKQLMMATAAPEEQCMGLAVTIIRARNKLGAKMFGIDIAELLEADDALTAFKKANNIK